MRPLFAATIALLALLPAACEKKSASGEKPAQSAAATAGVPGPGYDTSEAGNAKFMADYAALPGVKKTADGLMYRVIKAGTGPQVQKDNDVVSVYYKGSLINGKVFDQTKPEEPIQFPVGGVIPGWTEALKKMKTGDTWEVVIPSELGYGADGSGDAIPPDQTLVFTMSLVKVEYAP